MVSFKKLKFKKAFPLCFSFAFLSLGYCTPNKNSQIQQSEVDAITAVSNKWFSNNVRGYMWALSVTSLDGFETSLKSSSQETQKITSSNKGVLTGPKLDGEEPDFNVAPASQSRDTYYQCWYYAETKNKVKPDGQELISIFLSDSTKNVNKKFVDMENFIDEFEKDVNFKRMLRFSVETLSAGVCGILPLIKAIPGGALISPICAMALTGYSARIREFKGGDTTTGSNAAKEQIIAQVKSKADELNEINWDALNTLHKKVEGFNGFLKQKLNTNKLCPEPSQKLVKTMGVSDAKGNPVKN
jgi:hypothetical protein